MSADPTQLKVAKTIRLKSIGLCIARLPQTDRLFIGGSDFKVYEFNLASEKPEPIEFQGEGHQSYVTGAAIVGSQLVTGGYDGRLIWWDIEQRQPIRKTPAHDRWIRKVVASADGKFVVSVADDMLCKVWDAASGQLVHTFIEHKPMTPHHFPSMLFTVAYSADGQFMATADKVGHIAVWEAAGGKKLAELEAPVMYTWDPKQRRHSIGGIRSVSFSPDGRLIAVGGIGTIGNIDHLDGPSRVEIFDWRTQQRIQEISDTVHKGLVEQIAFPVDASWLIFAGGDNGGFVSFYDVLTGKMVHQSKLPMHVHAFVMNEAQDTVYAAGHDQLAVVEFKTVVPAPKKRQAFQDAGNPHCEATDHRLTNQCLQDSFRASTPTDCRLTRRRNPVGQHRAAVFPSSSATMIACDASRQRCNVTYATTTWASHENSDSCRVATVIMSFFAPVANSNPPVANCFA